MLLAPNEFKYITCALNFKVTCVSVDPADINSIHISSVGSSSLHLYQIYLAPCCENLLTSSTSWLLHAIHWCALLLSLIKTPIRLSNLLQQLQPPCRWLLHHSNAQFIQRYWLYLLRCMSEAVSVILGFFCLQQQQLGAYCNNFSSRCSLWPF